jgi:hypothetical protein
VDPTPFLQRAAAAREQFGVMEVTVDETICEGDRIAWRWTLRSERGVLRGVNFQRVVEGRVVVHWTIAAP